MSGPATAESPPSRGTAWCSTRDPMAAPSPDLLDIVPLASCGQLWPAVAICSQLYDLMSAVAVCSMLWLGQVLHTQVSMPGLPWPAQGSSATTSHTNTCLHSKVIALTYNR